MPNETWKKWIYTAYQERISLSATGYYSTPNITYDWKTNTGNPFAYFTYGVATTLVEIDCLTGIMTTHSCHVYRRRKLANFGATHHALCKAIVIT